MRFDGFMRLGGFSLAMLLGFAAQAATLDVLQGGVLVSRGGSPYQMVNQPINLRVGDSVIANPGGAARVVYENGCAVEVRPGMVLTVSEPPACDTGSVGAAPIVESTDYTALAVGAAVVAGGVGIAIAVSGGGGGGGGSP